MVLQGQGYDVWLDGMGRTVADIFMRNPQFVRDKKALGRALNEVTMVTSHHSRKRASEADVVVTTSGMLDGGPVLHYLGKRYRDPKSSVLMTGYQVEGTNGRMLLETGHIEVDGARLKVECQVDRFDFSSHAGHEDLVRFAKKSRARHVVLFHGDHPEPLMEDIGHFADVHAPAIGEDLSFRD